MPVRMVGAHDEFAGTCWCAGSYVPPHTNRCSNGGSGTVVCAVPCGSLLLGRPPVPAPLLFTPPFVGSFVLLEGHTPRPIP